MMKCPRFVVLRCVVVAATAVLAGGGERLHSVAPQDPPTFTDDVARILHARCSGCHRPGEIAPMPLLTYEEARPWARSIRAKVAAREMPPWPADPRYGRFRNEHVLPPAEASTLIAWADAGAPRGDGVPPPPPRVQQGWSNAMGRPPDLVLDAPVSMDLPPSGVIPEFRVWSKLPFGRERFIEALELRPTNRATIHHASVFRVRLPGGAAVGPAPAWPGGPILDGLPMRRDGSLADITDPEGVGTPLVFYVPAGGVLRFPRGAAKRLGREDYLAWVFHLTTTGRMERAGARLGLWFARGRVEHEVITTTLTERVTVNGGAVPRDQRGPRYPNIAPHVADYRVAGYMQVREPIVLYALWPHMHARGRSMTFTLEKRDGTRQVLLSIPRYRYAWQFTYELSSPMRIAAGDLLKAEAQYDNSSRNDDNPNPAQDVVWGPQADNEMFDPFIEFALDRLTMEQRPSSLGPSALFPSNE